MKTTICFLPDPIPCPSTHNYVINNGWSCCKHYKRKFNSDWDGTDILMADPKDACIDDDFVECHNVGLGGLCIDGDLAECKLDFLSYLINFFTCNYSLLSTKSEIKTFSKDLYPWICCGQGLWPEN